MVRISFVLLLIVGSCTAIHNKKHFNLLNYKSRSIPLKTDGYYYSVFERDTTHVKIAGKGIYMKVLLNNNAMRTIRNGYGYQCGKVVELECEIKQSERLFDEYQNYVLKDKPNNNMNVWNWGKYSVENDTIRMQWFYNKFGEYYLIEEIGIVQDSTTFKLIKAIDYGDKTSWEMDRVFKFKPYPVKNMYNRTPLFDEIIK